MFTESKDPKHLDLLQPLSSPIVKCYRLHIFVGFHLAKLFVTDEILNHIAYP